MLVVDVWLSDLALAQARRKRGCVQEADAGRRVKTRGLRRTASQPVTESRERALDRVRMEVCVIAKFFSGVVYQMTAATAIATLATCARRGTDGGGDGGGGSWASVSTSDVDGDDDDAGGWAAAPTEHIDVGHLSRKRRETSSRESWRSNPCVSGRAGTETRDLSLSDGQGHGHGTSVEIGEGCPVRGWWLL